MQTKSFATLVDEQITAIQGGSDALVDFTVGSILRAIVEAYSALAMWLQGLVLQLLARTRAATSTGADLDSWVADYGLTRLPAVPASGYATFSRFTSTTQALIPVGALVQSADGSQQYAVALAVGNAAYRAASNGYTLNAGQASIDLPIAAVTAGAAGNAVAGGVSVLAQAIAGVDTVANGAPLTNGEDAEADTALRTRFVAYLASLAKATPVAVGFAVASAQAGVSYTLVENQDYSGAARAGYFYVVVDDGSGSPPQSLLAAVYAAVDAVRPIGSVFGVYAPVVTTAAVAMQVSIAAGYDTGTALAAVQAALTAYIDGQPNGAPLRWSRLFQVAYDATPAVADVVSVTINGAATDLIPSARGIIKAGTISATAV